MTVLAFAGIQLIPDGSIFIHIVLILLMIWILNRTFFRPINKVLASRAKNTGGRSSEAQEILNQVNEKNRLFDEEIRQTRTQSYELIENTRNQALAQRQQEINEVKEELATLVSNEKETIAKQKEEARQAISVEAQKMAEQIASNILKA